MKTTLDLPEVLMRKAKIRAASEGRKLKDVMAELVERGLATTFPPAQNNAEQPAYISHPDTGLPVVRALDITGYIPPTLADSLSIIEKANEEEDLCRAGLPD